VVSGNWFPEEGVMNITRLELLSADLGAQRDFYAGFLELPVRLDSPILEVQAGKTKLLFTEAPQFDGALPSIFLKTDSNPPKNGFQAGFLCFVMKAGTMSSNPRIGILIQCISKTRQGTFSNSSLVII
jgi:hypothetical protein